MTKGQWSLRVDSRWILGAFVVHTETTVLSVLRQDYGVVSFSFIHHCHRVTLSNVTVL